MRNFLIKTFNAIIPIFDNRNKAIKKIKTNNLHVGLLIDEIENEVCELYKKAGIESFGDLVKKLQKSADNKMILDAKTMETSMVLSLSRIPYKLKSKKFEESRVLFSKYLVIRTHELKLVNILSRGSDYKLDLNMLLDQWMNKFDSALLKNQINEKPSPELKVRVSL